MVDNLIAFSDAMIAVVTGLWSVISRPLIGGLSLGWMWVAFIVLSVLIGSFVGSGK